MEKMKFEKTNNSLSNAYLQELKNDPRVITLFKQYHLDLDEVKNNVVALSQYIRCDDYCQKCHGLNMCNKQLKGYRVTLDQDLNIQLSCCKYLSEKQQMLAHKKNYLLCDLSDNNLTNDIEQIDLQHESDDYKEIVSLVKDWLALTPKKAFYFHGPLGVGKSFLASCITNALARKGLKVAFVNFPSLVSDIRTNMTVEDYVSSRINKMKKAQCLVIDDIGAENISAYVRDDVLFTILDYRMENKLATIFTSNCDIKALTNRLKMANGVVDEPKALRIMERINALAEPIGVQGTSRRSL